MDADHGSVAARKLRRVATDLAIILLPDPGAAGEIGTGHELEQIRAKVVASRNVA